ncbi:hypothetical protein COMNV_00482 [Commensalibacter sp. Nvir]|uniref:helix-turn-helix domain-containing protein n=1 Tax=Commensalibacter sp. Nvir TaxID=3069817 RepID=UPI002D659B48|nr:hypothetical protein COMNV_00482 [Commensalibacter sp. Nvir]
MARNDALFQLRLPEHLREKLEKEAGRKKLSLTAEILNRLEESFSNEPNKIMELMERVSTLEKAVFFNKNENNKLEHPFARYRKLKNLTLEELAEKLDLSPSFIRRIEKSQHLTSPSLIVNIGKIFDIPLDTILKDIEEYKKHT